MLIIHALINGPFDTPYEGGFFYFILRCPPNYPFQPPRVRLMTTSNGQVRFNPNLYKNGKVCLSILGTWQGPKWLPSQNLTSVLISIQSLLNSTPYHNEPGHDSELKPNASKHYNDIIRHETLRVAVCENLENEQFLFREAVASSFLEFYDYYVDTCKANIDKDKEEMNDLLFGEKRGKFKYTQILSRLEALKLKMDELVKAKNKNDDHESDLSDSLDDESSTSPKKQKKVNENECLNDYELADENDEYF
jgi:ubiquitin-conjugating enzyme E2 Z